MQSNQYFKTVNIIQFSQHNIVTNMLANMLANMISADFSSGMGNISCVLTVRVILDFTIFWKFWKFEVWQIKE